MTLVTKEISKTMGQTGEGITSEDQIREGTEIANKWEAIRVECPWYFDMKALITKHPNVTPTGLGNSTSEIDMEDGGTQPESSAVDAEGSEQGDAAASSDDDDVAGGLGKRKASDQDTLSKKAKGEKKTQAQPGLSTPAMSSTNQFKKAKLNFEEVAKAEEMTRQKELERDI
ncbi:hypothetical protein GLOTRDRAFT_96451 [Gloeophyllum trabeum ATCC 11539]|uniref:No apical meristem-associated C-terminal domain-containing protein n=1 Tax=Gloeophyllum trabeum (strain ATCC 11539 / FP-39264 / Madison 617) TaxID=670483 RepID=S7RFG4_GLOTA|nr:uncharacterized protein GLOTRDRAFT_96451 [Gloeophyllum trabeum ATCC 11539]EPQ51254.1 hypothetical protein GLOTRDRAFT_96451 [Gloeophyllum trabeum ATCC 11539]